MLSLLGLKRSVFVFGPAMLLQNHQLLEHCLGHVAVALWIEFEEHDWVDAELEVTGLDKWGR